MNTVSATESDHSNLPVYNFPIRLIAIATMVTVGALSWWGWSSYQSYKYVSVSGELYGELARLQGEIIHLDEVLTMSARMAVAANDSQWIDRYENFEPKLDFAIKKAIRLSKREDIVDAASTTDKANIKLVEMERLAFALIRVGRGQEAKAILYNQDYVQQKQVYADGMAIMLEIVRQAQDSILNDQKSRATKAALGILIVLLIVVPMWLIAIKYIRGWRDSLINNIKLRKNAEDQQKSLNLELEKRVKERSETLKALREAQAELVKKERLATLGQLTATVSHELRNPLGTMLPALYMIKEYIDANDAPMAKAVARIERSIERCDRIIDEMLDFARIRRVETQPVILDQWLRQLLGEQSLAKDISLSWALGMNDLTVQIDPEQLSRAVINVFENACQSLLPAHQHSDYVNAEICIATRLTEERIELSIADNGRGIPADVFPRVFEPLFSTKNFGVGLGLSVVKDIIQQHGGDIEIDTEQGHGTRIILWLPLVHLNGKTV